ncbi:MAG: hypothetical protein ACQEWD_11385 [Bacteroidota bacterium]
MSRKLHLHLREYLLSRVNPKEVENLKGDRKKFLSAPEPNKE